MRNFTLLFLLTGCIQLTAQMPYKYRVFLTDKTEHAELLSEPERLLSVRALNRRAHHQVDVDSTDLPVSASYLRQLEEAGYPVVCTSRWMNTAVVASSDSLAEEKLIGFGFVGAAKRVWKDNQYQPSFFVKADEVGKKASRDDDAALLQLKVHNGDKLHQAGYRGEGMEIAVIDAGFINVDRIPELNVRVKGTYDFVDPTGDIFATNPHGTNVLSVMATPAGGGFSGTAPEASYWLLRSEDSSSEYPVEEDYWIAAAEYADSIGVDVINSSLGYSEFDDPRMNYTHADINGKTAFITRGASMAASKGILVVSSAGNERQRPWVKISFPSDSPDVLTVGAVNPDFEPAPFTGAGFVTESYVKPDVTGLGNPTYVLDVNGALVTSSGTSFSSPVIAGLAACLWQSLPELKNYEVMALMREFCSLSQQPDSLRGFGLPDVFEAYRQTATFLPEAVSGDIRVFPVDTLSAIWKVTGLPDEHATTVIRVFNSSGRIVNNFSFVGNHYVFNLNNLEKGLYIIQVQGPTVRHSQRIHLSGR